MIAFRRTSKAFALALLVWWTGSVALAQQDAPAAVPFLSIAPSQAGAMLQVNFPAQANGDSNRLLYRVDGQESLDVDLQVVAGTDEVGFPIGLFVTLLVDGKQTKFQLGGAGPSLRHALTLASPGTVVRSMLSLSGQKLSPGIHNIDLLLWRADGVPFPCWSFLAVKGAPGLRAATASEAFERRGGGRRPATHFVLSTSAEPLFGPLRRVQPSAAFESLTLRAQLERGDRGPEPLELAVAALLDGRQVSFAGSGAAPGVELGPAEVAKAELRLPAFRTRGEGHQLIFFLLRRPSLWNLSTFLQAQFSPTRQLGGLEW